MASNTWATRQAELHQQILTEQRVAKMRSLYWFGMGSLCLNGAPAIALGTYSCAKSNEYEGVTCLDPEFAPTLEPTAVTSNLYRVGFFLIWGALTMLMFSYTTVTWFERMQQVSKQPKAKGKIIASFREFGTTGVALACCVLSLSIFFYVMFVLSLMLLSGALVGASEECGEDESSGGQLFSAASFANGMSWLYIFVTGGEIVLGIFFLRWRAKREGVDSSDSLAPPGTTNLGHEQDETEAEDLDRASVDGDASSASGRVEAGDGGGRISLDNKPRLQPIENKPSSMRRLAP